MVRLLGTTLQALTPSRFVGPIDEAENITHPVSPRALSVVKVGTIFCGATKVRGLSGRGKARGEMPRFLSRVDQSGPENMSRKRNQTEKYSCISWWILFEAFRDVCVCPKLPDSPLNFHSSYLARCHCCRRRRRRRRWCSRSGGRCHAHGHNTWHWSGDGGRSVWLSFGLSVRSEPDMELVPYTQSHQPVAPLFNCPTDLNDTVEGATQ